MKKTLLISVSLMFCMWSNTYSQSNKEYKYKLGTQYCDSTFAIKLSANALSSVAKLETTNSDYTISSFVLSIPRGKDFDNLNSDGDNFTNLMKQKIQTLSPGTIVYISMVQAVYNSTENTIEVVLPSIPVKIE
ncbi:MAG: GldM family protein [Bacteroidales bacterium]|jgi:hypothetical protein